MHSTSDLEGCWPCLRVVNDAELGPAILFKETQTYECIMATALNHLVQEKLILFPYLTFSLVKFIKNHFYLQLSLLLERKTEAKQNHIFKIGE